MAGWYFAIKHIHVGSVVLSFSLFFLRGLWMVAGSPLLQRRWVKIVPHIIDTILLASAIWLTLIIHQYPLANDWLTAKVVGLLVYIGLGMVALRRGKTRKARIMAWTGALLAFGYIVAVALSRDPLPLFQHLNE